KLTLDLSTEESRIHIWF
ncbi:hypothetical protein DBR06_SOUSAS9610092, partial [Sousa chinensis]